jgi:hypothetical protein
MNLIEALEEVAGLTQDEQIDKLAGLLEADPQQLRPQVGVFIHRQRKLWGRGKNPAIDRGGRPAWIMGSPNTEVTIETDGGGKYPIEPNYARAMTMLYLGNLWNNRGLRFGK